MYKRIVRFFLRLGGKTEEDAAYKRIVEGRSWEEFCDTLKSAGASIMGMDSPKDPLTQAEGYRYLSRLIRAGLEAFIEYSDPKAPVLRRMVDETVKIGADNPDNYYQNATISGKYEYKIIGKRNTVRFLSFSTQKGTYGEGRGLPPTGFLDGSDVEIEADGTFEIIVSTEEHPKNWLPMEPETGMVMVRQTFGDKKKEVPAELELRRIDGDGLPTNMTPGRVDAGLRTTAKLVAGASILFAKWSKGFREHVNELPQMPPEVSTKAGGDPKIAYYHSYWQLERDQALVIDVTPPECEFWNFQLNNHWMESLDYRYYTIHVNKCTAVLNDDGSVQVVAAHEDPGCPNWISTAGHCRGTMLWRWIKAESHPRPRTKVVRLQELRREYKGEQGNG